MNIDGLNKYTVDKPMEDWAEEIGIGRPTELADWEGQPVSQVVFDSLDPEERIAFFSDAQKDALRKWMDDNGVDVLDYDAVFDQNTPGNMAREYFFKDAAAATKAAAPRSYLRGAAAEAAGLDPRTGAAVVEEAPQAVKAVDEAVNEAAPPAPRQPEDPAVAAEAEAQRMRDAAAADAAIDREVARVSPTNTVGEVPVALKNALNESIASGNTDRFEKLSALIDQKEMGIPYYIDDVKGAFSEYFTKGSRDLKNGISPKVLEFGAGVSGKNPGGRAFIVDLDGNQSAMGNFVPIDGDTMPLRSDNLDSVLGRYKDVLTREDAYLRISRDEKTGGALVQVVRLVQDPIEAQMLTDMFDKPGYFTVDGKKVTRPGRSRLDGTEGAHMKSVVNQPRPENPPASTTKQVAQQMNAEKAPLALPLETLRTP